MSCACCTRLLCGVTAAFRAVLCCCAQEKDREAAALKLEVEKALKLKEDLVRTNNEMAEKLVLLLQMLFILLSFGDCKGI